MSFKNYQNVNLVTNDFNVVDMKDKRIIIY